MCLAIPAKVVTLEDREAVVEMGGNRLGINIVLTPGVKVNQWVLVHAGFAIATIEESDALETWAYLRACYDGDMEGLEGEIGGRRMKAEDSKGVAAS